jgi:hypothetical protein
MSKIDTDKLRKIVNDEKFLETVSKCLTNGQMVELKKEGDGLAVIGVTRQLKNKMPIVG